MFVEVARTVLDGYVDGVRARVLIRAGLDTTPGIARPFVVETWYKNHKGTRLTESPRFATKTEANYEFRSAREGWVDDYKLRRVG